MEQIDILCRNLKRRMLTDMLQPAPTEDACQFNGLLSEARNAYPNDTRILRITDAPGNSSVGHLWCEAESLKAALLQAHLDVMAMHN